MFTMEEAALIKSIPLNCHGREDKKVWHYTRNGFFTMMSAYYFYEDIQARAEMALPITLLVEYGNQSENSGFTIVSKC